MYGVHTRCRALSQKYCSVKAIDDMSTHKHGEVPFYEQAIKRVCVSGVGIEKSHPGPSIICGNFRDDTYERLAT